MRVVRTALIVVAVAGAGVAGSLLVGRAEGVTGHDLGDLALAMLPSYIGTVVAVLVAQRVLARASIVWRMVSIATVAAAISLANLAVASRLMFVSSHDAQVLVILLASSVAAGVAAAVALARGSRVGVERLMAATRRLGGGDLSARVGRLDGEPELRTLAATLDEMADQLSASIEKERSIDAARRDLMTAVSHDLRTPLARVKAIAEALEHGVIHEPDEARRYAAEIGAAVDALTRLVDDLLDVVRADSERITRGETVVLRAALDSALAVCEPVARQKGIRLRTDLDGAGEAPCSPRVERVLQNLLVNAVRHTEVGEVTVRAERRGAELVVEVRDTGEGIPAEELHLVFEPFWRGDSSRSSPGSGLGLTLARRLVEHLGGAIEVRSEPGVGTTFTLRLPAAPSSPAG